jgi:hypothetical protein
MYRIVVTIFTTSLTFTNYAFCPHSVVMCFVWISEQTAIISLYSINWLVFVTETECVYCAVRTGYPSTIYVKSSLWRNDAVRVTVVTVVDQLLIFCVSVPFLAENFDVSEERTASFLRLSEPPSGVCGDSVIFAIRRGSHLYSFTLKIDAVRFFETSLHLITTLCRNRKEDVQRVWLKSSTETDCDFRLNPSTRCWVYVAAVACFGELLQMVGESEENIFFKVLLFELCRHSSPVWQGELLMFWNFSYIVWFRVRESTLWHAMRDSLF